MKRTIADVSGFSRATPRWPLLLGGAGALAAGIATFVVLKPSTPPPAPRPAELTAVSPGPAPAPEPAYPSTPPLPADPAAAFAALARQGGIVAEAKSAPELYHNARLFEARGDTVQARRAYHALALLGLEQIDPHLRYAGLLRVQDGRAGARETYTALLDARPTRVAALIHALQSEGAERRTKVEAFVGSHPDYVPAQYLLAEEYSEDRLGSGLTIRDKRVAFAAYDAFLEADRQGRLIPFFLDQSVLASWLERARRQHAALSAYLESHAVRPSAQFIRSNDGWIVSVALPEPALSIAYRVGETGEFKPTGFTPASDPRTGKPFPSPNIPLPNDQGATTIYLRYEDMGGRQSEVAAIPFEPREALFKTQRSTLDLTANAWLAFRSDAEQLLYFTHLVSYRCAIHRAVIALDDGPMERPLPLPPCDAKNPYSIPYEARTYLTIPKSTRSVSIQLTFADGSVSEVRTFRR